MKNTLFALVLVLPFLSAGQAQYLRSTFGDTTRFEVDLSQALIAQNTDYHPETYHRFQEALPEDRRYPPPWKNQMCYKETRFYGQVNEDGEERLAYVDTLIRYHSLLRNHSMYTDWNGELDYYFGGDSSLVRTAMIDTLWVDVNQHLNQPLPEAFTLTDDLIQVLSKNGWTDIFYTIEIFNLDDGSVYVYNQNTPIEDIRTHHQASFIRCSVSTRDRAKGLIFEYIFQVG